ncbi:unnamed protein product, partial [Linum tenue]
YELKREKKQPKTKQSRILRLGGAKSNEHLISLSFPRFLTPSGGTRRPSRSRTIMSYRSFQSRSREIRSSRSALFDDGLEEGGLRASVSFSSEIKEHDNDAAVDTLQDRVSFLKRIKNFAFLRFLKPAVLCVNQGNGMDVSRGVMSGTMDRFKAVGKLDSSRRFPLVCSPCLLWNHIWMTWFNNVRARQVFEKKSSRRTCALAGTFVLSFLAVYYLLRYCSPNITPSLSQ